MGLFSRNLTDAISETKTVKVCGVRFKIKKIDVLEHLKGHNSIIPTFDTYKKDAVAPDDVNIKKLKQHYIDVFLSAVISPKISSKQEDGFVFVENLFNNWDLCTKLYEEIIVFTYGKKKLRSFGYRANG